MSRTKKFKMTDLGPIPEDWEVRSMGEHSSIARGGSPRPIDAYLTTSASGVNWIKIGDSSVGGKYIYRTAEKIISEGVARSRLVHSGDLLLSNSMSFGRPYILKIDGCIHDGWLVIQDYKEVFDTEFLYYVLGIPLTTNQYRALAAGSGVQNLNKVLVSKVSIIGPRDICEQRRIAAALSDVDELIASLTELLDKKRNLKKGAMQQLLTGKRRLPGFTGKWVEKRLGRCAQIKARIGWQGLTTSEYLESGPYYLIGGTDFKDGRIDWDGCFHVSPERYRQDVYIQTRRNDVLVTKDGTIGKVAVLDDMPGPGTLNSGVYVIRSVDEKLSQVYLSWIFLSTRFDCFIDKLAAGSTISHLYQRDIVNFEFIVPPTIAEQKSIAEVLTDMDNEIAGVEAELEKAKNLKTGMMQQLLTGKVRLEVA